MPSILRTVPFPLAPSIPRPERRRLWCAKPTAATITCINLVNLLIGVVWEVSLQFYMGWGWAVGRQGTGLSWPSHCLR